MFKIVISGVNLTDSGKLSVLQDCLNALIKIKEHTELDITVLVHNASLVDEYKDHIKILAFPDIKSSWIKRVKFEYFYSKKLSLQLKPDLWFGLHDMTANVVCPYQVVYCHNSAAFYDVDYKNFFTDIKFTLFNLFYKYLYRINIKRNRYVIIQQIWLRKIFEDLYDVKTIVAYPIREIFATTSGPESIAKLDLHFNVPTFFYPSFPRVYKNYEVLFDAVKILNKKGVQCQVVVTLDGSENNYAKKIADTYRHIPNIKFIGLQDRQSINELYKQSHCLVFPSKLESWGLPISEFKEFNKPMLIARLPYADETVGNYNEVSYFPINDASKLAVLMEQFINGTIQYDGNSALQPADPFFNNWDSLMTFLTDRKNY
ncbi:glycosyltransferase family 1 protein [Mucilaginibacter hurinus]|uniref:Glycosyltransferase family 1 protein n=1 Tax=Mucilaginibacter hurinus TaxID=2201324 RepID=A0A367GS35_9SPHI|nr:glycosyltransferase [Mucilaginibacter hurinus]RCH55908.1 glycosyltransferase family 1 protein [Mucilaginibacter hurinus]